MTPLPRAGPGRRDAARDPGPGAGRPRHHHRRRDPPGELLQRFATALEGVDIDNPGTRARPQRPPQPGAANRRPDPPAAPGRGGRRGVPARHTDRTIKITVPGPFTMAQQAQNDFYASDEAARSATRRPSTPRSRTCSPPGRTSSRSTSPTCRPGRRRPAVRRGRAEPALDGITGTTAVHLCFGYAAIIHDRPSGYSFLPELAACPATRSLSRPHSPASTLGARRAPRQDDHPRRDRSR